MLTEQQERFCVNIVSGMNQTAAYKDAYDAEKMKIETIYVEASRLMDDPKITLRIEELRKEARNDKIIDTMQRKEMLTQWFFDDTKKEDSRLKALDMLNKMDGEYIEKVNLSGDEDKPFEINVRVVK